MRSFLTVSCCMLFGYTSVQAQLPAPYPLNPPPLLPAPQPIPGTPLVQPLDLPVGPPVAVEPLPIVYTPKTFARSYLFVEGHHKVCFEHPYTCKHVEVCFDLPCGTPKCVHVLPRSVIIDYGKKKVRIVFRLLGTTSVYQ